MNYFFIEGYERIKKLIVTVACKFVKPVPGLMTITITKTN